MDKEIIPYATWLNEAELVFQEELRSKGWSPSPDSIMRRAHSYVVRVDENEHGGHGSVVVWAGWQQAMRRKHYA